MKNRSARKFVTALSFSTMIVSVTATNLAVADDEGSWQNTKQSASDFWNNFKQDSKANWKDSQTAFRDGWIEGKLATAIVTNEHLNPFDIEIEVDSYTATLSGKVSNEIQVELAEAVAIGVEGIDKVKNNLSVDESLDKPSDTLASNNNRSFARYLKDVTLVADIKTDLIASSNIDSLDINVDAYKAKIILNGKVKSEAEKDLVEKIAINHDAVASVENNLKVENS